MSTNRAQYFFDQLMKEQNLNTARKDTVPATATANTTSQQAYATQQLGTSQQAYATQPQQQLRQSQPQLLSPQPQPQVQQNQYLQPNTPAFNKRIVQSAANSLQQQQYAVSSPQDPTIARTINNAVNSSFNPQLQQQFTPAQLSRAQVTQISGPTDIANLGYHGQPQFLGTTQYVTGPAIPRTVAQIAHSRLQELPRYIPPPITSTTVHPTHEQFKSSSKIEYIPFNRKIIEYQEQQKVQVVPRTKKIVDYREERVVDVMPRQVVKQDYYAVEYIKQYVPEYVPEKKVNIVQRAVPFKRIEYVPVTRQVYHGAPFGGQGNVPFCCPGGNGAITAGSNGKTSQISQFAQTGMMPWQNNINMSHLYGTSMYQGMYGHGFGGYGCGCCDQFRRKFNNIYDSYDAYVPSFKY